MEKMRNLVAIVILQLIITIAETKDDFAFGDMIAFERKCCQIPYNHYAIYVGKEKIGDLKKSDEDIFHFTGNLKTKASANCVFGKLNQTDTYKKSNYLDGMFTVGNKSEITDRIIEKHGNCKGNYSVRSNNCEHLATYVRYGERLSLQRGKLIAPIVCKNDKKYNITKIKEILGRIDDPEKTCEELCSENSSRASG